MSKKDEEKYSDLNKEERLKIENEIDKLKLSAFHDAKFSSKSELPLGVENEWLNYIKAFEEQFENVDQITVAERLGNPDFPAVEELSEQQIKENLDQVLQLMYENGISLDALAEVTNEELYRFITEELFLYEIDDFDIEGMQTCFIYEEFHPNDRLDIEQSIDDFITEMLSKKFQDYLSTNLAEECLSHNGVLLTTDEAVQKAIAFADLYEKFTDINISNFKIDIEEDVKKAAAEFNVEYKAHSKSEAKSFKGNGTAKLQVGKLGYWNIVSLKIPGFVI